MHIIEFENADTTERVVILEANRETLLLSIHHSIEMVPIESYLIFGQDLIQAYERLEGKARLENRTGQTVLDVTLRRGKVLVTFFPGDGQKSLETDQSYLTTAVRQVGLWE